MANGIGGLGSLTYTMRNGKKYWTGRITLGKDINGKQVRKSFSSYKKSDVIDKMKDAQNEISIAGFINNNKITLGKGIWDWLYNVKSKDIKSSTMALYTQTVRDYVINLPISNMEIKDFNIMILQKYFSFLEDDKNIAKTTERNLLTLLKMFFDHCIVLGIMNSNPALYIKLAKKETESERKVKVFSGEEQTLIIKNLNLNDDVEKAIYLDFYCGVRRGELRGFKWSDFRDGGLYVSTQLRREYKVDKNGNTESIKDTEQTLKTKNSERFIPLPTSIIKTLDKWKLDSMMKHYRIGLQFNDDCLMFTDDLCQPIEEKRITRRVQSICKKLNIPIRNLHSIRHSYATRLFENGVEIKTVQALLGHSDFATTIEIYTHVMQDTKQKAVQTLDAINLI